MCVIVDGGHTRHLRFVRTDAYFDNLHYACCDVAEQGRSMHWSANISNRSIVLRCDTAPILARLRINAQHFVDRKQEYASPDIMLHNEMNDARIQRDDTQQVHAEPSVEKRAVAMDSREVVGEEQRLADRNARVVLLATGDNDGYLRIIQPNAVHSIDSDRVNSMRARQERAVHIADDQFHIRGGGECQRRGVGGHYIGFFGAGWINEQNLAFGWDLRTFLVERWVIDEVLGCAVVE
jgi:hypothetical protein